MTILVTGATGFVGGRLTERLAAEGHRLRLLVRDPDRARASLGADHDLVACDLSASVGAESSRRLDQALEGCDTVIHTAALVKNWVRHPAAFETTNVGGTWALAEAALRAGVTRFLYTSSFFALGPAVAGRPVDETALEAPPPERFFNDYHSTKFRAARLIRDFVPRGLPLVTVIPTVVYGPGRETEGNHVARILRWLQRGRFPGHLGGGRQRWNLAYVDDVVQGHLLALERGRTGEAYILGGHDYALRDLATLAAGRLGVRPPTRDIGWGLAGLVGAIEEWKAGTFGIAPQLTRGEIEIYKHEWIYTSAKAERELGYRITPFTTAFEATLEWLQRDGMMIGQGMESFLDAVRERGLAALAINGVLAFLAWRAGSVRPSGIAAGLVVGGLIYLAGGPGWFVVLAAFFVLGSGLTRLGYGRKAARGLAEEKGGRRGWQNAVANGGVGVLAAVGWLWTGWEPLRAAFAASFATAIFDTAGSEIGGLYGKTPISLRSFRRVPPGTEGAVSLEGTLGALASAAVVAAVAVLGGVVPWQGWVMIVVASFIGGVYESLAAGKLPLGHQALNFTNTFVGALVAVTLCRLAGIF